MDDRAMPDREFLRVLVDLANFAFVSGAPDSWLVAWTPADASASMASVSKHR